MPSSISSSETFRSAPGASRNRFRDDVRSDLRRVELRTAIAGLLLLTGGLLFTRCHTEVFDILQPEKKRLHEAIVELPAIAAYPQQTALFFGSSLVWNGFLPEVFDARLSERGVGLASFNLGFGGLNPEIQRVLARRLRTAHEAVGRRAKLAIIEFNPFQTTRVRAIGDGFVRDQHLMMLATRTEIAALALEAPERAARYFSGQVFRNSLSAETVTGSLGFIATGIGGMIDVDHADVEKPSAEAQRELDRRKQAVIDVLVGLWRAHGGIPRLWELEFRGEMRLDFPETHDALEIGLRPNDWNQLDDLEMRLRCCDIEELRFDEALVEEFIALVAEFSAFADHVEVVLMPVNHAWVKRTAAAEGRLRAVVERIERETAVRVVDFQSTPSIDPEQFFDVTHLSPLSGARVFSAHLADHYAQVLAPGELP